MTISNNAKKRMNERHVTTKQIRFAIRYGDQVPVYGNATLFSFEIDSLYRGRERMPSGARGVDVILANESGNILTVYRKTQWKRNRCN